MKSVSYKSKWIVKFERDREYFAQETGHFNNWERRTEPDNEAWIQFLNSQIVLFGDGRELASKFLRAISEVVDRAVLEGKLRQLEDCPANFPYNRGRALRVRAYAEGLNNSVFETKNLLTASDDFKAWGCQFTGADWDSQSQAYVLAAARMALIAGDLARAREVLQTNRSFKWHAEEHSLLKELVAEAPFGLPIRSEQLLERTTEFFDRIRDPDFKPDIFMELDEARLEWGAIINKYFESGGNIDWNRVVELVAR